MKHMLWLLLFLTGPVLAQVQIETPWARATPPGAEVGGGYLLVRNQGAAADRLVAASSPVSAKVELHVHVNEGGVMKMREVSGYDVPARGRFELKPGGAHLMFIGLKKPLAEGDKVPVTLKFEKAGEVKIELQVGKLGSSVAPAMPHRKH